MTQPPAVRNRLAAALSSHQRRVRAVDRAADRVISISGLIIIVAVLGIGLFLFLEIVPLLLGARVQRPAVHATLPAMESPRLVLVDEYQEQVVVAGDSPAFRVIPLAGGEPSQVPVDGFGGRRITAASRLLGDPAVALGSDDGRVWLGTVAIEASYEAGRRVIHPSVAPALTLDVSDAPIRLLAYRHHEQADLLVAGGGTPELRLIRATIRRPLIGAPVREESRQLLTLAGVGRPTAVLVDDALAQVWVGTDAGMLMRWRVGESEPALIESAAVVPGGSVTTLAFLLGDRSIAVGGSDGSVATWGLVPNTGAPNAPDGRRLARTHSFAAHPRAITAIAASPRDKGFVTASAGGEIRLHYMTTERTMAVMRISQAPGVLAIAPKADGVLAVDAGGRLHHWRVDNPHPDVSWRALFGKLWYEGYAKPEYIWQSHGGTDDFESKFSLVPLIFGTMKGTFYALLFSIPLAVFGALYTSQFLTRRLRVPLKSTVETMAALPSVVLGFLAGLVISPFVQHHVVAVLTAPVIVPVVAVAGMVASLRLPAPGVIRAIRRYEFLAVLAWLCAGLALSLWTGPLLEQALFGGNFEVWLAKTTGLQYDQRNSLVVGWAMGFAVIPIIFTICEDGFSSVPSHLSAASLALGASPWQTAVKVVLPAAGSAVFSAVMVGFGRAIGETMIVLMATGNTPVMDWSVFNGFRALSANIAVEIPEAARGSSHYRVLFVAALLLFSIAFMVNTVAEVIRLRMRKQLAGL